MLAESTFFEKYEGRIRNNREAINNLKLFLEWICAGNLITGKWQRMARNLW